MMKTAGIILVSVVLSILGALTLQDQRTAQPYQNDQPAYRRVTASGTLRCGYIVWPPEFDKDTATGQMSGIAYDIITETAHRLNLKITWVEEVNFATMAEGLKTGRYDAICFSLYRDSPRALWAEMTAPFYYSGQGLFIRTGDGRFSLDHMADINDPQYTVAVIDGEMSSTIARHFFPRAKTISLPQTSGVSDVLMNVITKKADLTFANALGASLFDKHNPGRIKNLTPAHPLALFSHGMAFKKGEVGLKNMFDIVIEEMHNQGIIKDILARYALPPGTCYSVAQPYEVASGK